MYIYTYVLLNKCIDMQEELAAYEASKKEAEAKGQKFDPNTLVRPRIKLSSCLQAFIRPETVEQYYSSALNEKTTAQKYVVGCMLYSTYN